MYTIFFFQQNGFHLLQKEKGNNSYQPLEGSDTRTESTKVKIRVSDSEAGLAKIHINMDVIFV